MTKTWFLALACGPPWPRWHRLRRPVLRAAVRYPTAVLRRAGVPPVVRDEFRERAFPEDSYDLAPAGWKDVDESLHEPGIIWGAWKAKTVMDRHRPA